MYNEGETAGAVDSFGGYGDFTLGQPCGFSRVAGPFL